MNTATQRVGKSSWQVIIHTCDESPVTPFPQVEGNVWPIALVNRKYNIAGNTGYMRPERQSWFWPVVAQWSVSADFVPVGCARQCWFPALA